jgi:YMGG-like Gly-zipper
MTNNLRTFAAVMVLLAVAVGGTAQKTTKKRKGPTYYSVHAGQTMRVRLNQDLKSETAHIGETFTSTLVDPVYSSNGVLLAPQGSIVHGRVTNVQRAQKNGKPATLDVVFTSIKLPSGYSRAINGSLTDLSSKGGSSDNEGTVSANKTSHRKVKFIGGGAAGGAVIGAIAGGGKGLAIGAGVGALAGGITGRLKKGSEVKVSSGTEFGVILNQAVSFPKYAAG